LYNPDERYLNNLKINEIKINHFYFPLFL
jgi:hypothetical protein